MSCCGPTGVLPSAADCSRNEVLAGELRVTARTLEDDLKQTDLSVPSMHCAACIQTVEAALGRLRGVEHARVNLTTRRVAVRWRGEEPPAMIQALEQSGYSAFPFDASAEPDDPVRTELLRALAVAGFAAMNIMVMSVAVWAGAAESSRELFHAISALLAVPALLYSGRIFFVSAWKSLRQGRTNMDVPISIGVLLAFGMSLYDTLTHGPHAYFDAAVSLLFFLLIGRTLDHLMRKRAHDAVSGLARLAPRVARRLVCENDSEFVPVSEIEPGMRLRIEAGERVPVDGVVEQGRSDVDRSLVSGESVPRPVSSGSELVAGTLNLTGPVTMRATAAAEDSFLAEMVRMMDAAEEGRSAYRRIADRAAQLYAPAVHLAALVSLCAWLLATGDLHQSITVAVAVLIITCPCAIGLAVPMVQVMAARRLFEAGIMVKDGGAIERLAEIDTVMFDKTGTLTLGEPRLVNAGEIAPASLAIAAKLASHSSHPYSRALAEIDPSPGVPFTVIREIAGLGVEGHLDNAVYRLGHGPWAAGCEAEGTVLGRDGSLLARFQFEDTERPGARLAVAELSGAGLEIEIVSGDAALSVEAAARQFGIGPWHANQRPKDKLDRIRRLQAEGHRVLMVGDGINDGPALAAADVSMAPADGADTGRNAADFVFLRKDLRAVPTAISLALRSARLVRQNFGLAVTYNALALPLAITGHVTPLIAALAMSLSSVTVIANSMRLRTTSTPSARIATARAPGVVAE